ncbi:hypothetical protein ACFO1B_22495 [Dactylosporangium siamense]|uniref:hypothetical protein n=1 Tax=Dactylosporangium siamense TaxID=685454 RepID=UPI0019439AE8|nr:hypothetical protein [Dactylosporangium siamense]
MTPAVAMILLAVNAVWDVVCQRIGRDEWIVLDTGSTITLLVAVGGATLARGQYAMTVRPYLGWRFTRDDKGRGRVTSPEGAPRAIHLYVHNGGSGVAFVENVRYRLELAGGPTPDDRAGPSPWLTLDQTRQQLRQIGLIEERDFYLMIIGPAPMPPTANPFDGVHVLSLTSRAVHSISNLDIRFRATDLVGDVHEWTLTDYVAPQHRAEIRAYHATPTPTPAGDPAVAPGPREE